VPGLDHPAARAALREIVDLHRFFEAWLGGTAEKTERVFARVETALADEFTMVEPGGSRLRRADVIRTLRAAHGAKGRPGPFEIAIAEPELLVLRPPLVVLGYVEEQTASGALTRRRSTAVLEAAATGGSGVRWLALQETWIGSSL
jgi:hypothetical protein